MDGRALITQYRSSDSMTTSIPRRVAALLTALAATAALYGVADVAASSAGLLPAASAQAAPQHNHMAEMLESLGLSDAQKSQIRGIMDQAREQNKNVSDREQKRANMKAAMEKVRNVLTPDQRAKLDAKIAEWRKSHPGGWQGQGH
jgi:Spy/CpxP family protein refolding chaperone